MFLVCSGLLCVSRVDGFRFRGSPLVPVSLLLSSFLVGSFLCLCFCFFLLLGSSSSVFCASSFYCSSPLVPSCCLCCCASLSGSFLLGFALLRSFLSSAFLSLALLGGGGGGGVVSGAVTVLPVPSWVVSVLVWGLLHGFSPSPSALYLLLSLLALLLLCLRLLLCWLPHFLFSGFAALGWCSILAVFLGLFLPEVPRPSCLLFFSASGPPLLSCALSVSSRLCCFYLSSCPLRGSVPCFSLRLRVVSSLSLSLRLFPRSPYLSLLFVLLPLLHLSLSTFGFCFCGSFRSSLVASAASVAVSSDPQVRVPPSFPGSFCPSSLLLCRLAVCALLQASGFLQSPPPSRAHFVWCFSLRRLFSVLFSRLVRAVFALPSPTLFLLRVSSSGGILEFFLSLPSLLLLLCLYWVLFVLSPSFCWLCSPDLCFPFSSWAFVPWACACRVLFSGSVGVPLTC